MNGVRMGGTSRRRGARRGGFQERLQERLPAVEKRLGGNVRGVQTGWRAVEGHHKRLAGLTVTPERTGERGYPTPPSPSHKPRSPGCRENGGYTGCMWMSTVHAGMSQPCNLQITVLSP